MAIQINYLSIDFTIGGHQLFLETTKLPSKDEIAGAASSLADSVKELIMHQTYKMQDGQIITVSLSEFFGSVEKRIPDGIAAVKEFFKDVAGVTTGISIDLWDLYLTTFTSKDDDNTETGHLTFGFKVRVNLSKEFYENLSVPEKITSLISLNSLGLGAAFEQTFPLTPKATPPPKVIAKPKSKTRQKK